MFNNRYSQKKVLITGNTGFKGAWLSLWLKKLGAEVVGLSDTVPTTPSHFEAAGLDKLIDTRFVDIRNCVEVNKVVKEVDPDFIFHMAAQALVKKSYEDPVGTFEINAMGTANILQSVRQLTNKCNLILITSDKCYENVETYYGYREDDQLGGADPYSASKASAEIIISSFTRSFFEDPTDIRLAIARAGNVIGGGDWATDRLVPDMVKSWNANIQVDIRRPMATRPWQLVLEPLSGYLALGAKLDADEKLHGEAFNFGPAAEVVFPVKDVAQALESQLVGLKVVVDETQAYFHEAGLLKLCCDKALSKLSWKSVLDFNETLDFTANWYKNFYSEDVLVKTFSDSQLDDYINLARDRKLGWVQDAN